MIGRRDPSLSGNGRSGSTFSWGLFDQGISSLTNLALSVVAGRMLGPAGLGVVFLGFSFYLIMLSLQRSLVCQPLVVTSAVLSDGKKREATGQALTSTLILGALGTLAMALIGWAFPGIGAGMLFFALWIVPALVQEYWRSVLFRDERGAAATVNELVWLLVMFGTLPIAISIRTSWAIIAAWGAGALAAALLGFMQTNIKPASGTRSWRWWMQDGWPSGRWLALEATLFNLATRGVVFILPAFLSTSAVGGLRAAQSIFAPLSLLVPAMALPGLPAMVRNLHISMHSARRLASRVSLTLAAVTFVYVVVLGFAGELVLPFVFGSAFRGYESLLAPVGAEQLILAASTGYVLLLRASLAAKLLVWARLGLCLASFVLVALFASYAGLDGAAWGLAIGSLAGTLAVWGLARSLPELSAASDPRALS
ncbi:MAG: hypothetical protein ACR2KQ_00920 [Actinomycetota bacterium]